MNEETRSAFWGTGMFLGAIYAAVGLGLWELPLVSYGIAFWWAGTLILSDTWGWRTASVLGMAFCICMARSL